MISNFYPVILPAETFQVRRVPFENENFWKLRAEYNSDNSFFRCGDFTYISPMGERDIPGAGLVDMSALKERGVVGSLVRHIFFRTFRNQYPDVIPLTFYPFRILSRKGQDDLLRMSLRKLGIDIDPLGERLARKKLIEVQFRDIVHEGAPTIGAVLNTRYNWTFGDGVSCASLVADGFDIIGRSVLLVEPIPGLDGILAPDENLIGTITSIRGGDAVVETNEGEEIRPLSQLHLHRSHKNINELLGYFLGERQVERIQSCIKDHDTSRLNAKRYQQEIAKMARLVSSLEFKNRDGFTFQISNEPLKPKAGFCLEDPKFRFDYGPGASNPNPSFGLLKHGPYDSLTFKPKSPRVAILCHSSARDAFTSFLGKLRDGIPDASNFPGGMRGKYRLQDLLFDAGCDFIEVKSFTGDEYEKSTARYLQNDNQHWADLVLIQTKDEFKACHPSSNPYYRAKARFMMAGIPTQFVKVETIRKSDQYLKFTIDSVALQAYAKMGGVPYTLPAGNNVDREIVVGIGHSVIRSNTFKGNDQDRVVGITTFFKADGDYLFGRRCREVPYSEYFRELLDNLRDSLRDVASAYGWRNGDAVRLVFHVFKPIRNIEAEVVAELVKEYPQYNITFAFVTISDRHPYVLFDTSQGGRGQRRIGEYVPSRRSNWVLDDESCLVQLAGAGQMSTALHGFSTPVLVRIHERSTFRDLHAIVQQVFNFTSLSWRSFKPSRTPVTIDYANQIANKLANLRKVNGWRPEAVNAPDMRRKKWFL